MILKDLYSPAFYNQLADNLRVVDKSFDKQTFLKEIFTPDFEQKELKERMRHTTLVLHRFLSPDFGDAVQIIELLMAEYRRNNFNGDSLPFMILPDYIELYGINELDTSIKALESITQFISCEFAVRPFILKYSNTMLDQMIRWSRHENWKVRRLASEGSRPRLPWAMALPMLKKDPAPILPLLENLKNDPNEWVRRSVANNLNDIAKDHPDLLCDIAQRWKGISKETDWVVKHGCRTLLKQGNAVILKLYGFDHTDIALTNLWVAPEVKTGDKLGFSFDIENRQSRQQVIRLEYGLYYRKANGKLARKVFKISERTYQPFEQASISRAQSFKLITTRKFYIGEHRLSIIVNGKETETRTFYLTD
jgi:3-methyladenine DNA glycosylase AlkC